MTITLAQVAEWAALKPAVDLSARAKLAWRRFAPVTIDGLKIAFPAKAALAWMKATGATTMTLDLRFAESSQGVSVRGEHGNSRINLCVYVKAVPCEEPYDLYTTNGGCGGVSQRCELSDMGEPSGDDERKAANHAKRLDKAKRDAREAKMTLDKATKRANEAMDALKTPIAEAIKQARLYLSLSRARRAFEHNPTVAPGWMLPTYEETFFDIDSQASAKRVVDTRAAHAERVNSLNRAIAERDAYKPTTRWPRYFTAKDKREKPDYGYKVYGPKYDKLNEVVKDAERSLLRFLETRFDEYVATLCLSRHYANAYTRARIHLRDWSARKDDLESKVNEAKAKLDKIAPGWQLWQKDDKSSWIHEGDEATLAKARDMGAARTV
jgi:hypothetical protein